MTFSGQVFNGAALDYQAQGQQQGAILCSRLTCCPAALQCLGEEGLQQAVQ